ncbi:MAG: MarR family transcriptional regulator [Chloroflexi bacterium]|nr:MarR family transcriptional regulator [Chloroflexota bacterium]
MSQLSPSEALDFLLGQVCRLHYARAQVLLDEIGLYRGQPPLLYILHEQQGLTHTELASHLQVTPATVTKMLQRLERAGFVQRRPDAADQRVSRVYLTDAGLAIQGQAATALRRLADETFAEFTLEERVVLRRLMLQMRDNLGRALGGEPPDLNTTAEPSSSSGGLRLRARCAKRSSA